MEKKERRHQTEDREQGLTNAQKEAIALKSDQCCAWCGKKIYFGYGATVDHYVPLKKGGTNEFKNLVMMCEDCNQKKGSMIIPVNIAGKHLLPKYQEEVGNYFEEFITSFEYLSRGNLIGADMYEIKLVLEEVAIAGDRFKKKGKSTKRKDLKIRSDLLSKTQVLRRAFPEDEDKLIEYFTKYLKKHKELHSEKSVGHNIRFWMRFGTIYFAERNGDISVMSTYLVNKNGYLSINLFPYYSTDLSCTIAKGIVTCIGEAIMEEQGLPYLTMSVNMLNKDPVAKRILAHNNCFSFDNLFISTPYYITNDNKEIKMTEDHSEGDKKLQDFFKRFSNIEDDVRLYLYKNNLMDYEWMADEIWRNDYTFDSNSVVAHL